MITLLILRHAKSSWDDGSLPDFERPLNERGLRTAPFMGELIKNKGLIPAVIISSPAVRAISTAELVKDSAGITSDIRLDDRIYEASPQNLVQVISEIDDALNTAMIVGHNPGFEHLIRFLTGDMEPMPTAALAVVALDITNWHGVRDGTGTLAALYRPREEMARVR